MEVYDPPQVFPTGIRCVGHGRHMRGGPSYLTRALAVRKVSVDCFRCRGRDYVRFCGGCRYSVRYHIDSESTAKGARTPVDGGCKVRMERLNSWGRLMSVAAGELVAEAVLMYRPWLMVHSQPTWDLMAGCGRTAENANEEGGAHSYGFAVGVFPQWLIGT